MPMSAVRAVLLFHLKFLYASSLYIHPFSTVKAIEEWGTHHLVPSLYSGIELHFMSTESHSETFEPTLTESERREGRVLDEETPVTHREQPYCVRRLPQLAAERLKTWGQFNVACAAARGP